MKNATTIDQSMIFEGEVFSESDIVIEGTIAGRVESRSGVVIRPTGKVNADLHADHLRNEGHFQGHAANIRSLSMGPSSISNGEMECRNLIVEEGARVNGRILMSDS